MNPAASIYLLVAVAIAAVQPARAAISSQDWLTPGDNLLTLDSITGREWLDLTETLLPEVDGGDPADRLAAFMSRLTESGDLFGFRVATTADVLDLAVSAGIDPGTSDISINGVPVATLATFTSSAEIVVDLNEDGFVYGLTASPELQAVQMAYVLGGRDSSAAYVLTGPPISPTNSAWVYREAVPEPSAFVLLTILSLASTVRVRQLAWPA